MQFQNWIAKLEKRFVDVLCCSQSFFAAILLFSFLAANWIKDCSANHGIWR
jgi:hypothetical protein